MKQRTNSFPLTGTLNTINLFNAAITIRLILTWFPQAPEAIVSPLSTICDPYLNLFRGIIPPIGGIDLSPILAFTALNLLSSTAAALPCEMPAARRMEQEKSPQGWAAQLAQAQRDAKSSK
jgi:YggT family protein